MWRTMQRFADLAPNRRIRRVVKNLGVSRRVAKYVTAGLAKNSWARLSSWLHKFRQFLDVTALDQLREAQRVPQSPTTRGPLRHGPPGIRRGACGWCLGVGGGVPIPF